MAADPAAPTPKGHPLKVWLRRHWPWLLVIAALLGCMLIDGLPVGRTQRDWHIDRSWHIPVLGLSLIVYAGCVLRSLWHWIKACRIPGRHRLLSAVVVIGLGAAVGVMAWTAFGS